MHIQLKDWQREDASTLQIIANDADVSRYLRNVFPYPYTLQDAHDFIAFAQSQTDTYMKSISMDGRLIGGCSLIKQADVNCHNAEIGYWLGKDVWHCGIASEVVKKLCTYGFEHLDLVRIYAEVFDANLPSCKVLEKNGFELEGRLKKSIYKHNTYMDTLVYGLIDSQFYKKHKV